MLQVLITLLSASCVWTFFQLTVSHTKEPWGKKLQSVQRISGCVCMCVWGHLRNYRSKYLDADLFFDVLWIDEDLLSAFLRKWCPLALHSSLFLMENPKIINKGMFYGCLLCTWDLITVYLKAITLLGVINHKSGPTLHNLLTKVKDPLPIEKQSNVVTKVPCTCGKRDQVQARYTTQGRMSEVPHG